MGITSIATFLVLAGLMVIPSPYVVRSPGPTKDTLSSVNEQDLISISNAKTYDTTGQLRLTTVGVSGGPGYPVNFGQVLRGWLDPTRAVYPVETVYPPDVSADQIASQNQAEMVSSQENATFAALSALGYDIPTTLNVALVLDGSPATGVAEGDVITALNGSAINGYDDLLARLDAVEPGTEITLGYERDGKAAETTFKTIANTEGKGSRLGIALDLNFDFPVDVTIAIDNIGGPSAGTMFALGIMDKLTPEDEVNGKIIAGTGTMNTAGEVGAIGGIQQKLHGAQRDGAQYFLAPKSNCDEVIGNVPDGLQVVAVSTLDQAWDAVKAIGADKAAGLPTCG